MGGHSGGGSDESESTCRRAAHRRVTRRSSRVSSSPVAEALNQVCTDERLLDNHLKNKGRLNGMGFRTYGGS